MRKIKLGLNEEAFELLADEETAEGLIRKIEELRPMEQFKVHMLLVSTDSIRAMDS